MKVTTDLDDRVFWRLAAKGELDGLRVDQVLATLAEAEASKQIDQGDPVMIRWGRGLSDKQIAAELNMTNLAVATRRRSFGLKANKTRSK